MTNRLVINSSKIHWQKKLKAQTKQKGTTIKTKFMAQTLFNTRILRDSIWLFFLLLTYKPSPPHYNADKKPKKF